MNHLTILLPSEINFVNLGTHLILVCVRVLHYLTKMARSPLSITIETVLEHGEGLVPPMWLFYALDKQKNDECENEKIEFTSGRVVRIIKICSRIVSQEIPNRKNTEPNKTDMIRANILEN